MTKKLYLSNTNKVFAGVCGGIGEYFEVDPVLVRIITVILFFATGFGLFAYLVAWIIVPKPPIGIENEVKNIEYASWHKYIPGIILIAIGTILLSQRFWFWFDFEDMWPAVLIIGGLAMIFMKGRKKSEDEKVTTSTDAVNDQMRNGPLGG